MLECLALRYRVRRTLRMSLETWQRDALRLSRSTVFLMVWFSSGTLSNSSMAIACCVVWTGKPTGSHPMLVNERSAGGLFESEA